MNALKKRPSSTCDAAFGPEWAKFYSPGRRLPQPWVIRYPTDRALKGNAVKDFEIAGRWMWAGGCRVGQGRLPAAGPPYCGMFANTYSKARSCGDAWCLAMPRGAHCDSSCD